MSDNLGRSSDDVTESFNRRADEDRSSIFFELCDFLIHNRKWWLAPIIVILLLVGALVMLSGTVAAPFIYTLF
jgi:hypothetical protein